MFAGRPYRTSFLINRFYRVSWKARLDKNSHKVLFIFTFSCEYKCAQDKLFFVLISNHTKVLVLISNHTACLFTQIRIFDSLLCYLGRLRRRHKKTLKKQFNSVIINKLNITVILFRCARYLILGLYSKMWVGT